MPKITINLKFCKGCGLCVSVCPKQTLVMSSEISSTKGVTPAMVANESSCIKFLNCTVICPDAAMEIADEENGG